MKFGKLKTQHLLFLTLGIIITVSLISQSFKWIENNQNFLALKCLNKGYQDGEYLLEDKEVWFLIDKNTEEISMINYQSVDGSIDIMGEDFFTDFSNERVISVFEYEGRDAYKKWYQQKKSVVLTNKSNETDTWTERKLARRFQNIRLTIDRQTLSVTLIRDPESSRPSVIIGEWKVVNDKGVIEPESCKKSSKSQFDRVARQTQTREF